MDVFCLYINYQKFRTVKFRTFEFRTLNFGQKNRYFGQFRTNISDKTFAKFPLFSPQFWQLCLNLAAAVLKMEFLRTPFEQIATKITCNSTSI